jgi:hypothetical protein
MFFTLLPEPIDQLAQFGPALFLHFVQAGQNLLLGSLMQRPFFRGCELRLSQLFLLPLLLSLSIELLELLFP